MIINIAHTKGGVGKSTIAINIAIAFNSSILDLDFQQSSKNFSDIRKTQSKTLNVFNVNNKKELQSILEKYENSKELLVIDSGGMDNDLNRMALLYSTIIIIPITASQFEIRGLTYFSEILKKAKLTNKACLLLNNIDPRSKGEVNNFVTFLQEEYDIDVLDSIIFQRKIYKDSIFEGISVIEQTKNKLAKEEILHLKLELEHKIEGVFK